MIHSIFPILFAAVAVAIHLFIGISFCRLLGLSKQGKRVLTIFLGGMLTLSVCGFPLLRLLPYEMGRGFAWVFYSWIGIFLLLSTALVVADALAFCLTFLSRTSSFNPARRASFKRFVGFTSLGATMGLSALSVKEALGSVAVNPVTIFLSKLSPAFDGVRLVQLSDLHIGALQSGGWLRAIVDRTNDLKPDIIVITGDLVDGSVDDLKSEIASLAELKAPLGVYFVTGNHDYYSGVEAWRAHVASLGIRVLSNERVTLMRGQSSESLDLAGVEDYGGRYFPGGGSDLAKALQGRDETRPLVLLAHQPVTIFEAAKSGVDLQLSGHTHGGQIWPFRFLVYLSQPYIEGLHRHLNTGTQIYVSRGTGCWGPPMRLGASAEITHMTLRTGEP